MLRQILTLAFILLFSSAALAQEDLLKDLQRQRPRLYFRAQDLPRLRQQVKQDPLLRAWHANLQARAQKMLSEKPIEHVLIGPRLLDKSRTALTRISTLAGLYLIDGDRRFADRAKKEMLTAAAFADWNPSHFLDVAEMTNAMAIGYDWLYDTLSPEERQTIRNAIVNLGIKPGLAGFAKNAFWSHSTHNWGQVCCGGLTVGALAIADEEPELARQMLANTKKGIAPSMKAFAPDGGFPEGPGYWNYATIYNIYYLSALESALNTDWGYNKVPGFDDTGYFRIYCAGPLGRTFNYADAGDSVGTAPQMFWLARTFGQADFTAHELGLVADRPSFFHLLWFSQLPPQARKPKLQDDFPLDAAFRGVNVAFFRNKWNDHNALFVGIKGGDNRANHSHLDLGSFVLDALGYRWAADLGSDNYNLPAYFGNKRWTYYRLRTESHNTLTLDGQNQSTDGKAPIKAFYSTPDRAHAVIDLSHGYRTQAAKVLRGLALLQRSQVLVQDELEAPQPVEVVWNFLTPAKIALNGQSATLTQGQATLHVQILAPENARFEAFSANAPPPQKQQPGVQNLSIRLPEKTRQARLAVLFTPGQPPQSPPTLEPLSQWKGE